MHGVFFMANHLFISQGALLPIFQLFVKLIVLFVLQDVLIWIFGKLLRLKNAPAMVNLTVYTSFAIILVWYINQYVWQQFSGFVQFFLR